MLLKCLSFCFLGCWLRKMIFFVMENCFELQQLWVFCGGNCDGRKGHQFIDLEKTTSNINMTPCNIIHNNNCWLWLIYLFHHICTIDCKNLWGVGASFLCSLSLIFSKSQNILNSRKTEDNKIYSAIRQKVLQYCALINSAQLDFNNIQQTIPISLRKSAKSVTES